MQEKPAPDIYARPRRGGRFVIFGVLGAIAIAGIACVSLRFTLIGGEEAVNTQWANLQSAYQRRLDLIPSLVETVKGAAKHERETLTGVTDSRSRLLGVRESMAGALEKGDAQQVQQLATELARAERSFISVAVEAYPQLRANESFLALQAQLEGTENRVNVERIRYNEAVGSYNTRIRKWSWVPLCGGFQPKTRFEAAPEAGQAPKVSFD